VSALVFSYTLVNKISIVSPRFCPPISSEIKVNVFKTFAQKEGKLVEVIQIILQEIKIYFERFLMRGFCHGRQKPRISKGTLHDVM